MNDNPSASLPVRRGPLFGSAAALFILGAAGCIAEAIVLQAFGFSSALPLAPQVSAPAPFGVFHDLRWVWTYAWSWPSAVWQLAALWVFRSSYDAALIGAAWPQDRERPSFPVLWRRSGAYTAIAIVVMSPWATYSFAAGATSYGPFLVAAIFASLLTALVMPRGVMTRMRWATLPGWHGTLLEHGVVQHDIQRLLGNGGLAHRPGWKFWFQLVRGAAAAWHPPALPLSFPPWHGSLAIDPAFGHYGCPAGAGSR